MRVHRRVLTYEQIRRDPRINWITKPVHKRREARGLTSVGKQVRNHILYHYSQMLKHLASHRTVDSARATVTTTLRAGRPGRSTTRSASAATDDLLLYSFCHARPLPAISHTILMSSHAAMDVCLRAVCEKEIAASCTVIPSSGHIGRCSVPVKSMFVPSIHKTVAL